MVSTSIYINTPIHDIKMNVETGEVGFITSSGIATSEGLSPALSTTVGSFVSNKSTRKNNKKFPKSACNYVNKML